jgi:hypothetical protein
MAAAGAGFDFGELTWRILETSFEAPRSESLAGELAHGG